jgi:uncharacterized membrane protein YphA (DoxX/SURF4 family)
MRYRYWITLIASLLLAIILLSAGVGKLIGQSAFLLGLTSKLSNPELAGIIAGWLPWAEIAVGLCLLVGVAVQIAAGAASVLVATFIFYNSWMIANGYGYKPCSCLGVLEQLIQGKLSSVGSLYIDIAMLVLALVVYFGYQGRLFNWRPWYWTKD